MKFNKNERFIELFKIDESKLVELTAEALRNAVKPTNWEHNYLDLPVRDRVTEIEFDSLGFKGLNTQPLSKLWGGENALGNPEDKDRIFRNNFLGVTLMGIDRDMELRKVTYKVAPNYLANIKNGEIFNIFDEISRLKFYNFLTDIANKDQNNWKIVTAVDKVTQMTEEEMEELYPWDNKTSEKDSIVKPQNGENIEDDNLPILQVSKVLEENNVSLLKSSETIISLAVKLKKGTITLDYIKNLNIK